MNKHLIFFFFTLFLISLVSSHLENGEDKTINGYIADFGYSPEHLTTKETSFFSLNLVNETTQDAIDITSTWVRISKGDEIFFSGEFEGKDGNSNFNYKFDKGGNYQIDVRFINEDKTLVETNYDIKVNGGLNCYWTMFIVLGILAITLILIKKRKHKKWK